jgi:4-amino-4-deoxy-L-arabinose transferase-like glycosyltransferase
MVGATSNSDTRNFVFKAALLLMLIFGLYLRVGAVLNTVIESPVRSDARLYYLYGFNLKHNHTFSLSDKKVTPDAFVPPVYPAVLTAFLDFPPTDRMLVNIGLFQAVLGTFTILFTYLLFQALGGRMIGFAAAALTTISPHLISLTVYMLTETLFTFLMMGGLLALTYAFTRDKGALAILAGIILGLAALTRSTLEYFPIFILLLSVALVFFKRCKREQLRRVFQFSGTAILVIAVWKIRNLFAIGSLSDPTLAISTLHHGMYPDFMFDGRPESRGIPYRFNPRTAEITSSLGSVLHEIAVRFQAASWQHLQWYIVGKPISLLSWSMIDGWGDIFVYPPLASPYFSTTLFAMTRAAMLHAHPVLMIAGVVGAGGLLLKPRFLGFAEKQAMAGYIVAAMVIYFILLHMIGAPFPRYGVPLRPIMYGLAAITIAAFIFRLRQKSNSSGSKSDTDE